MSQLTQKPNLQFNIQEGEPITYFLNSANTILARHKGKKGLLVDIGAHIGVVDVMATKDRGWDFAVAVEPHLPNFARLLDNININQCEGNILPLWAAVGDKSYQQGVLYSNNQGVNSGIQSLEYKSVYPSEAVVLLQLKDILGPHNSIDLLKIDIEGGEWKLFTEENVQYFEKAKWIDIELHHMEQDKEFASALYAGQGHTKEVAKAYLESCGFKLTWDAAGYYGPRK